TGHLRAARSTPQHGRGAGPAAAHHPISGVPASPGAQRRRPGHTQSRRPPTPRSAVPQPLGVQKDGGLVIRRAEAPRRIYRLNPDGVTALRAYLDRVWKEALTAFGKAAQAAPLDPEQEDQ